MTSDDHNRYYRKTYVPPSVVSEYKSRCKPKPNPAQERDIEALESIFPLARVHVTDSIDFQDTTNAYAYAIQCGSGEIAQNIAHLLNDMLVTDPPWATAGYLATDKKTFLANEELIKGDKPGRDVLIDLAKQRDAKLAVMQTPAIVKALEASLAGSVAGAATAKLDAEEPQHKGGRGKC